MPSVQVVLMDLPKFLVGEAVQFLLYLPDAPVVVLLYGQGLGVLARFLRPRGICDVLLALPGVLAFFSSVSCFSKKGRPESLFSARTLALPSGEGKSLLLSGAALH